MTVDLMTSGTELIEGKTGRDPEEFLKRMGMVFEEALLSEKLFPSGSQRAEISVSFIGSGEMRQLNMQHRMIDMPTDILSFPLWEEDSVFAPPPGWESLPLGDIVICPEKVLENAGENGKSFVEELVLVMSHGLLHLIGYDHCDSDSERRMWIRQEGMTARFFGEEGAENGTE